MPDPREAVPVKETSFQNAVDHQYSGKDRATPEYPNGSFGITPGSIPPRWTLDQLAHELMGEYSTQVKNNRAEWANDAVQILGIINQTVLAYALVLNGIIGKTYSSTTPEWDAWVEANAKA